MTIPLHNYMFWWVAATILATLNTVGQPVEPRVPATNSFTVAAAADPEVFRDFPESAKGVDSYTQAGPFTGTVVKGVDTETLYGKVMCGYQGWFGAPGDGSTGQYWRHWTKHRGPMEDGNAKVDLWPDVSELMPSERFKTGFKMVDGRP